jgi:hypothetical protein
MFVAAACTITSIRIAASSDVTQGAAAPTGAWTPTVWMYLPHVNRQEPPIPEPTNRPTPTPTPTTAPPAVYILSNHFSYVDVIDNLNIVGEVQNDTADHLRFVKITANVFSDSDQILDTDFTYIFVGSLAPGEKTCFRTILDEPVGWLYYEFESPSYWSDGQPLPNLTVYDDVGSYDSLYTWYEITGHVRNDHGAHVEDVRAVGTLYSSSGVTVGCSFTNADSTDLGPGQASPFDMLFEGRDYADVTAYRLQADGDLQ